MSNHRLPIEQIKELTLPELKTFIAEIDSRMSQETADATLILLAALKVGPDAKKISKFTGLEYKSAFQAVTHLENSGIFCGGEIDHEWFEDDTFGAFFMDVLVAEGKLKRVFDDSSTRQYTLTDLGKLEAEQILKTAVRR